MTHWYRLSLIAMILLLAAVTRLSDPDLTQDHLGHRCNEFGTSPDKNSAGTVSGCHWHHPAV